MSFVLLMIVRTDSSEKVRIARHEPDPPTPKLEPPSAKKRPISFSEEFYRLRNKPSEISRPRSSWHLRCQDDPQVGLADSDIALLKAAGIWHYLDQERVLVDHELERQLDSLVKESEAGTPRSALAQLVLLRLVLSRKALTEQNGQADVVKELPFRLLDVAIAGTIDGLEFGPGADMFEDFRGRSAFRLAEDWAARLRLSEINRSKSAIVCNEASTRIAKAAESLYGNRIGKNRLDDASMTVLLEGRDEVDYETKTKANGGTYPGGGVGVFGKFIKLEYSGKTALTNVLLVGRMKSTGIDRELRPEQIRGLAMTGSTTNSDVAALLRVQNIYDSMPTATFIYVPILQPGSTIRFVVSGVLEEQYFAGCSLSLYCDQGRVSEREVNKFGVSVRRTADADPLAKGAVWEGKRYHNGGFMTQSTPLWIGPPVISRLVIADRDGEKVTLKLFGAFKTNEGDEIKGDLVRDEIKWADSWPAMKGDPFRVLFAGTITRSPDGNPVATMKGEINPPTDWPFGIRGRRTTLVWPRLSL